MATSTPHPYSQPEAFNRLMILIATLVQCPGIGAADPDRLEETTGEHDAMVAVLAQMQAIATSIDLALPNYSVHTLRKDLRILRRYGILEHRLYRWGYYLGTGALQPQELRLALQGLAAQAQQQGDPQAKQVLSAVSQRLRGWNLERAGELLYPVRSSLNRVIVYTDPEEMMRQGQYRHTLFHQLPQVELAIAQGQAIELYRCRDPYRTLGVGALQVYPLQLLYADIAWYLLYEYVESGHLEVERVDRLSEQVRSLEKTARGMAVQTEQLRIAHQLLAQGWGLYLGQPEEQRQERRGELPLISIDVRFFPPVSAFILEGEQRHVSQRLQQGAKGAYVDYQVQLPRRSIDEFFRWVCRFMQQAEILAPDFLVERHQQAASQLVQRYQPS